MIKVLIADDHDVIREGLKMILEAQPDIQVVGCAVDGREAVEQAEHLLPDLILMDVSMPELNGIEAAHIISGRRPAVRIIFISMHHTSEHIHRALQAGGQGYLLKESAGHEIVEAVRDVIRGRNFFGSGVELPQAGPAAGSKSPLDSLSGREREILQYVVEGKSSAEIANLLTLSPKSVDTYRSRLMIKLGVFNLPSLVRYALEHGIIPPA